MGIFTKIARKLGFGKSKGKSKPQQGFDPLHQDPEVLQDPLRDPLDQPPVRRKRSNDIVPRQNELEESQDTGSEQTSTDIGESTVNGTGSTHQGEEGETLKVEPKGEDTQLTVELGEGSSGKGITEGVKGVTEGNKLTEPSKPKYKQMRVLMYTPFTSDGSLLDKQAKGTGPEARLKLLEEQLDQAMKIAEDDGPDTLRIFMAPEWFFATSDTTQYNGSDVGKVIKGLEKMSAKFPDLLLVPGSIKWSPGKQDIPTGKKDEVVNHDLIHNTQPVLKNGKLIHAYHKQHNGGDAPTKQAMPLDVESSQPLKDYRQDTSTPVKRGKGATSGQFNVDGIDFGLDICADFSQGTLARELIEQDPNHKGVDVHLVTSAGIMKANNDLTSAKDGGYTFISDGSRQWEKNAESQEIGWQVKRDGPLKQGIVENGKGVETKQLPHQKRNVGKHEYSFYDQKRNYSNDLRWTDKLALPGR